jgi:hypothetical protein
MSDDKWLSQYRDWWDDGETTLILNVFTAGSPFEVDGIEYNPFGYGGHIHQRQPMFILKVGESDLEPF